MPPRLAWCFGGLCVWLAFAQVGAKPDFSGTWRLNPAASRLEIPPPDSTVFYIDHKEPVFRFKRTHVFHGNPNTWSIVLTTDGKEVVQREAAGDFHARLRWEGEALILDSYWLKGDAKITNVVRYTVSDEGRRFTADERLAGPGMKHHNLWVFDRAQ